MNKKIIITSYNNKNLPCCSITGTAKEYANMFLKGYANTRTKYIIKNRFLIKRIAIRKHNKKLIIIYDFWKEKIGKKYLFTGSINII